jgi:hypothetical protein
MVREIALAARSAEFRLSAAINSRMLGHAWRLRNHGNHVDEARLLTDFASCWKRATRYPRRRRQGKRRLSEAKKAEKESRVLALPRW